ncbi:Aldehyde/histidinol dehydrogenase [Suillus paluster]|uniref:Aldehyde/histidinol dehydrogenase n=1 Tax=Suillus paluster TaxID=48578 RepID=UPI001B875997|nr:Aldehyde/histidinol dehydrogenase [Suillus paluster]KAG1717265.1 Aldehyde/histidinol dehydrogenase [Suillus paluster]
MPMEAAAKSNLKKVSLELGGKSPQLVFESDCTAGSCLYVQDTIYDKFLSLLVAKAQELVIGNGFDEKSGGGPVMSKTQFDKLALGGQKRPGKGFFVGPTIFTDIDTKMDIGRAKAFPQKEAISLANDTSYGLGAGLHSNVFEISTDANQCMRVSSALEAGTVWVNQYNLLNINIPFRGKKADYALNQYASVKAVHWNFGEKLDWPL